MTTETEANHYYAIPVRSGSVSASGSGSGSSPLALHPQLVAEGNHVLLNAGGGSSDTTHPESSTPPRAPSSNSLLIRPIGSNSSLGMMARVDEGIEQQQQQQQDASGSSGHHPDKRSVGAGASWSVASHSRPQTPSKLGLDFDDMGSVSSSKRRVRSSLTLPPPIQTTELKDPDYGGGGGSIMAGHTGGAQTPNSAHLTASTPSSPAHRPRHSLPSGSSYYPGYSSGTGLRTSISGRTINLQMPAPLDPGTPRSSYYMSSPRNSIAGLGELGVLPPTTPLYAASHLNESHSRFSTGGGSTSTTTTTGVNPKRSTSTPGLHDHLHHPHHHQQQQRQVVWTEQGALGSASVSHQPSTTTSVSLSNNSTKEDSSQGASAQTGTTFSGGSTEGGDSETLGLVVGTKKAFDTGDQHGQGDGDGVLEPRSDGQVDTTMQADNTSAMGVQPQQPCQDGLSQQDMGFFPLVYEPPVSPRLEHTESSHSPSEPSHQEPRDGKGSLDHHADASVATPMETARPLAAHQDSLDHDQDMKTTTTRIHELEPEMIPLPLDSASEMSVTLESS